jgi:predicted helicase
MRKTLAEEFSDIYVLNLRGNQRTAGEQSRKEGGKVFGGGSRATVAITVLVKNPAKAGPATIHYEVVADYLSTAEKLALVSEAASVAGLTPVAIKPNEHGDWLGQRDERFGSFMELLGSGGIFGFRSQGLTTARDSWVYGYSRTHLAANIRRTIAAYDAGLVSGVRDTDIASTEVSWSRKLRKYYQKGQRLRFDETALCRASYRPFTRQHVYYSRDLIEVVSQTPSLFPRPELPNLGFQVVTPQNRTPFAVLMVDSIPDLGTFMDPSQFCVRWRYEPVEDGSTFDLGGEGDVIEGHRRIDNITDDVLKRFVAAYGELVTKDDIFFYVYGLLHSPEYRETYAADLKKMLPRIPLVEDPWPFVDAGRRLSELHLGYESVTAYPLDGLDAQPPAGEDPYDFYRVQKMAFAKVREPETNKLVADRSSIVYSSRITVGGIPEAAYRYMLGSRSAVEWIIDRYQVKTDKGSGIVNDPNAWSREVENPRYILDLLARIVTVSLETMAIVDGLPPLAIREDQNPA